MTERKPPGVRWESWIERQIREGVERGEFDDLPGAGKPLAGLDQPRDELAWVRDKLRREEVSLLPPTLAVRKELEDARARIAASEDESEVRRIVEAINERIRHVNARATSGPPSTLMPLDVDQVVEQWRVTRSSVARPATRRRQRMTPIPTGRWSPTNPDELMFTRSFRASIEDVWASITESDRTALWFASWTGEAGPGRTIRYRLVFEDGAPEADLVIEACKPPRRLVVATTDEHGQWRLEARLTERDGVTELTLVHHVDGEVAVGEVGPGWEYYLDMLVASREGSARPDFDDYYPAQKEYFEGLDRT